MRFLLDTCVISEMIKPRPNKGVIAWVQNNREEDLYLSVLTLGEIQKGIEKLKDVKRRRNLYK